MPRLLVTLPDGSEVTHEMTEETISLGRVPDNTIQIEDASVSSHHAELTLHEGEYALKDLGSTNGTRVNGQSLEPETAIPLHGHDQIIFGHIAVQYVSDSAAADAPPLPAESAAVVAPASSSAAPSNFANASPFQTKKVKKDPAGTGVLVLAVVALLGAGYAIFAVLGMKSPM